MKTILIVDDSSTFRLHILTGLQAIGFSHAEFLQAKDGRNALDIMESESVDLIVSDLIMPVMDGEELLKKIKSDPRYTDLPVLIMSSSVNPVRETELKQMGAFAVIAKPFTSADLFKKLHELIPED